MALNEYPCTTERCIGLHGQLVLLVFLTNAFNGGTTPEALEEATKTYRGMSESQQLEYLIAAFSDELVQTATSEALKCWKCYPESTLRIWLTYLMAQLTQSRQ